jgi:hypothetical protein
MRPVHGPSPSLAVTFLSSAGSPLSCSHGPLGRPTWVASVLVDRLIVKQRTLLNPQGCGRWAIHSSDRRGHVQGGWARSLFNLPCFIGVHIVPHTNQMCRSYQHRTLVLAWLCGMNWVPCFLLALELIPLHPQPSREEGITPGTYLDPGCSKPASGSGAQEAPLYHLGQTSGLRGVVLIKSTSVVTHGD